MSVNFPRHKISASSQGFTLLEVIISIFIFSLIAYGVIFLMSNILTSVQGQTTILADTDQARKLVFQMVGEMRNAAYGADGGYPLNTAQDQQIVFYSNADSDATIEKIRYYVQSGKLYKGITEWNGSAYSSSTEQTFAVQNDLGNASAPLFYYYNDSYAGTSTQSALTQPVSVLQVSHVKLNLKIFNKAGATQANTYTVTGSATMRNLKTNLGE